MRRTISVFFAAALILVACGSDDDTADATEPIDTPVESDPPAGSDPPAESDVPVDDPAATAYPDKPDVEIPDQVPTELDANTLIEGSGPAAEAGDMVIVDYVGVRTVDGVEFDSSYERQAPFAVTLGRGEVIAGWDNGLVGRKSGERVQLDIPSDLAYGEQARDDIIGENEALTFVIDVRAVIAADPAGAPTEAGVPASEGATEVTTVDLIEGDGETLEAGETAVFQLVVFRGDNLVALTSSWEDTPIQMRVAEPEFPGIVLGMPGMKVGGRRAITVPPELGFGVDGNPQMGLPAETDIIIVVDLLGRY